MAIDAGLVRTSFSFVEPQWEHATAYFYGRLFAENPHLRSMFPVVMDAQRDRLFRALAGIVAAMDSTEQLTDLLGQLGRDHRKYGVLPEHYTAVGRALLATVSRFAATRWDDRTEAAWVSAYTVAANTMIESAAADGSPAWWPAEVVSHELRATDVAVLRLRPAERLPYQAGQYLSVQTPRWPRVWRHFSAANAPREDNTVDLHVRAVPGGLVSTALVKHTKAGDFLTLGPPVGTMVPTASGRDLLLVAGGTGLAPLKAITEHVIASGSRPSVHLLVGARTAERLYDLPALLALSSRYARLRLHTVISDQPSHDGMRGKVSDVLERFHSWAEHEAFVSGPEGMVEATVRRLREGGVPGSRIHHDLPRRT